MKAWILAGLFSLFVVSSQAEEIVCMGHSNADILCDDWKKHYNTEHTIYNGAKWGVDLYKMRNIDGIYPINGYPDYLEWLIGNRFSNWGLNPATYTGVLYIKPTLAYGNDPQSYQNPPESIPLATRYQDLVDNLVYVLQWLDANIPNASSVYVGVRMQWTNPGYELCERSPLELAQLHLQAIQEAIDLHGNTKVKVGPYFPDAVLDVNDFDPADTCHPKSVNNGAGVGSGVGTDKLVPIVVDFFDNPTPPPTLQNGDFNCSYYNPESPFDCLLIE